LWGIIYEAHKEGAIVYGIEPDELSIKITKLLFKKENKKVVIKKGYGENILFKDNFFDLVISNSTIEHVNDPEKILNEMIRVLKKDGLLWLKCPNFIYPFERHYKRFYFPFLSKKVNQIYFNLIIGIKSNYFLHINRITPFLIINYLKKNNLKYENLSIKKSKNIFNKILYKFHFYPQIEFIIKK
jgi:ubiquinone/menaquinone biosynthesis C-methylase UbiE